jgi:hypothetical protein
VYDIVGKILGPTDMIKIRRDFTAERLSLWQQGDNVARKQFHYAKRLLFNSVYNYMLKDMIGAFWLVCTFCLKLLYCITSLVDNDTTPLVDHYTHLLIDCSDVPLQRGEHELVWVIVVVSQSLVSKAILDSV